jgi:NAD(P)-dependent dehydrogenase (short-subunit alcohol dehydrogenase family)
MPAMSGSVAEDGGETQIVRRAVVTGAGSGIGRQVAISLLEKGHDVALWDRDPDAAAETARLASSAGSGRSEAMAVDVSRREDVERAAAATSAAFGGIDGLVTSAGITELVDFLELTDEQWDRMLGIHLRGTFLCVQAAARSMRAGGYGRIVCIGSLGAFSGSPRHAHYAAAKAGIVGLAKALAKELGPMGMTINVVSPGAVDTPMVADVPSETLARYRATPVGRIGTPEDVAESVEHLLFQQSGFISGAVLDVTGGV